MGVANGPSFSSLFLAAPADLEAVLGVAIANGVLNPWDPGAWVVVEEPTLVFRVSELLDFPSVVPQRDVALAEVRRGHVAGFVGVDHTTHRAQSADVLNGFCGWIFL